MSLRTARPGASFFLKNFERFYKDLGVHKTKSAAAQTVYERIQALSGVKTRESVVRLGGTVKLQSQAMPTGSNHTMILRSWIRYKTVVAQIYTNGYANIEERSR